MEKAPTLYKYLDINGAKSLLYYGQLKFTNSTQFDDPFDCHPSLIDCSNVPADRCFGWPPHLIEELEANRYERFRDTAWICCLSKINDSPSMWSNYANHHDGVCVGFSREALNNSFHGSEGRMVYSDIEVVYRDITDKPNSFGNPDAITYQMSTKDKSWEYEQEVRLFIMDPSPRIMMLLPGQNDKDGPIDWKAVRAFPYINDDSFESIYIGIKVAPKDREQIIKLAKARNPNIKVYQMKMNNNIVRLVAEPIE